MNEMTGSVFKIKRDPRVTLIGESLAHSSIDELPQLLNCANGAPEPSGAEGDVIS